MCRVVRKPLTRPERFRFQLGFLLFQLPEKEVPETPALRETQAMLVMADMAVVVGHHSFGTFSVVLRLIQLIIEQAAQAGTNPEAPVRLVAPEQRGMLVVRLLDLATILPEDRAVQEARAAAEGEAEVRGSPEAIRRTATPVPINAGLRPAVPLAIQLRVKP